MKISLAVPTWECHGKGREFLNDLLRTIEIQTHKDFEVCISDHSKDDWLINECKDFKDKIDIKYSKNLEDHGNSPANTNRAISMCSGDIIKVMFQDDFFWDDEALEKIHGEFESSDSMWLVNGCNHTNDMGHSFFWEMFPRWNEDMLKGKNTISSPSVLSMRKECFDKVKFDKNLIMLMDCEYYYSLQKNFGDPIYLDDILITNRLHGNQISSRYDMDKIELEVDYCIAKHS